MSFGDQETGRAAAVVHTNELFARRYGNEEHSASSSGGNAPLLSRQGGHLEETNQWEEQICVA